jgi:hypothetical protein
MRRHLRLLLIAFGVALAPALWPDTAQANHWRYRRHWYGGPLYGAAFAPRGFYGYRPYGYGYGYGFRGFRGYGWGGAYPVWGGYGFGMPGYGLGMPGYGFGGYPAVGYGYGYGGVPVTTGFYATSLVLPY